MISIVTYTHEYKESALKLIRTILDDEFCYGNIKRPDLYDISNFYQGELSNFWVAIDENKNVVGTIAFRNYGNGIGHLKRMYVAKDFRGTGLATKLLETLLEFAKQNNFREIYLATNEKMVAANKFYQKAGFQQIEALPENIPPMDDNIFYKMVLS